MLKFLRKAFILLFVSLSIQQSNLRGCKIDAVAAGFSVGFSSVLDHRHDKQYTLDSCGIPMVACGWRPEVPKSGHFAIVSSDDPKLWTDVITQGRADYD